MQGKDEFKERIRREVLGCAGFIKMEGGGARSWGKWRTWSATMVRCRRSQMRRTQMKVIRVWFHQCKYVCAINWRVFESIVVDVALEKDIEAGFNNEGGRDFALIVPPPLLLFSYRNSTIISIQLHFPPSSSYTNPVIQCTYPHGPFSRQATYIHRPCVLVVSVLVGGRDDESKSWGKKRLRVRVRLTLS